MDYANLPNGTLITLLRGARKHVDAERLYWLTGSMDDDRSIKATAAIKAARAHFSVVLNECRQRAKLPHASECEVIPRMQTNPSYIRVRVQAK